MDTFSVRDLREHTGSLIHDAAGKINLVMQYGKNTVFVLCVIFNTLFFVLNDECE